MARRWPPPAEHRKDEDGGQGAGEGLVEGCQQGPPSRSKGPGGHRDRGGGPALPHSVPVFPVLHASQRQHRCVAPPLSEQPRSHGARMAVLSMENTLRRFSERIAVRDSAGTISETVPARCVAGPVPRARAIEVRQQRQRRQAPRRRRQALGPAASCQQCRIIAQVGVFDESV